VLDPLLDVFRMRQYFDVVVRARDVAAGVRADVGFVAEVRRALLPLPLDRQRPADVTPPFGPARAARPLAGLGDRRVALLATGGSGALASVVGVARAMEDAGVRPALVSVCSGSALFGFPIAAGIPADEVAAFVLGLRPADYLDVDWGRLARLVPTAGRGFAGVLRGEAIERAYRALVGDMTLGELPIPAYAPIWNVETNTTMYIGPRTTPSLPVARAVRMAVALPLFFDPVALHGGWWCDGGIVDIFPVHPALDIEPPADLVLAVNGFYPHDFTGEDAAGWRDGRFSIVSVAAQVRTCQQLQLARENLARLRAATEVHLLHPVPYKVVQGVGFYRQFLGTRQWGQFMRQGRTAAAAALRDAARNPRVTSAASG